MNLAQATLMPNPSTPMAFLPPSLAQEFEVTSCIYLASTGALIWDWLMNMPDEYRVASLSGIPISKIAYFCARVFSLAFCLSSVMFQVAPVSDCQGLEVIMAIFIMFALNANNVLYFLRVRAVYGKSRIITAFFGFFGFGVFGTTFFAPFTIKAQHIGPTSRCVTTDVHPSLLAMMFSNATFGTLVFLAISYRITSQSVGGAGWRAAARGFFCGDGAPRVGKLLLHHGQLSYLATSALNIALVVMAFRPHYQSVLTIPVLALESVMACRVHRAVIIGLITSSEHNTVPVLLTTFITETTASTDDRAPGDSEYGLYTEHESKDQSGEIESTPSSRM